MMILNVQHWARESNQDGLRRGSKKGGPDPALTLLYQENPASRNVFITILNPVFLSQKNTLQSLISIQKLINVRSKLAH